MLKTYQITKFSIIPKTGIAFPKAGALFLMWKKIPASLKKDKKQQQKTSFLTNRCLRSFAIFCPDAPRHGP